VNNKERLRIHEEVFQKICCCGIIMNPKRIQEIVSLIRAWGYATNAQNGTASDAWVRKTQDKILQELGDL
jgi:hypothetical protein